MVNGSGIDRRNQQPVDPAVEHHSGIGDFLLPRLKRLADDQVKSSLVGNFFHAGNGRRLERTVKPRNNDADGIGSLAPEIGSENIGPVTHFVSSFRYPLSCLSINRRVIVKCPTHRGGRNPQLLGNIIYSNFLVHNTKGKRLLTPVQSISSNPHFFIIYYKGYLHAFRKR